MTYAPKRLFVTWPSFSHDDVAKWPCDVTHGNDHVYINDDPFPDPCSNFQPDRSRNTRARAKKPQKWAKKSAKMGVAGPLKNRFFAMTS